MILNKTVYIGINYILISMLFVIISYLTKPPTFPEIPEPIVQIKTFEDSVAYYIHRLEFEHPHIVFAQAKLESGNFNSLLFRQNNNMFGMRFPKSRETVAIREVKGFSYYESWQHSVIDLRIYYSLYLDGKTEDQVYSFLRKRYAESPSYISALQKIIQRERLKEKFKIIEINDNLTKI